MRGIVCVASALVIHAAVAGVVTAHTSSAPKLHVASGASIEVDELPPKPIDTLDEEVVRERIPEARQAPMRGAPSPVHVIALAAASVAPTQDSIPDPPPVVTATPHFGMTLGGSAGGAETQTPPRNTEPRIFSESEVTDRATLLSGPKPIYPSDALADGIELDAPLAFEIVVDTNGAVISTRALAEAGHGFDEAALTALRAFRFTPAKRDGELVRVRMRWTVEFRVRS